MPLLVYIAGPYRADSIAGITANIRRAEAANRALLEAGYYTICPHTNSGHLDGCVPDEHFLAMGLEQLRRCDAICVLPGSENSSGTQAEAALARELRKVFILHPGIHGRK